MLIDNFGRAVVFFYRWGTARRKTFINKMSEEAVKETLRHTIAAAKGFLHFTE
jgi:hypothetical protein